MAGEKSSDTSGMGQLDLFQGTGTIEEATSAFEAMLGGDEPNPDIDEDEEVATSDEDDADASDETTEDGADEEADSEAEEETEAAALDENALVTVKIDGQDLQIPLKEALLGYQRQADYSRKTQELAAHRNAFMQEVQQVRQERQVYAQLLPTLEQQIRQSMEAEPDWQRLREVDPLEYTLKREEWRDRQEQLRAVQEEQARLAYQQQQDRQRALNEYVTEERQRLIQAKPEWQDRAKWEKARDEIRSYAARAFGYSPEELAQAYDHRAILAMEKAMKYDRLMAKAKASKTAPAPNEPRPQRVPAKQTVPTAKPGSSNLPPRRATEITRAKQRLAKTGSVKDAASIFEIMLKG